MSHIFRFAVLCGMFLVFTMNMLTSASAEENEEPKKVVEISFHQDLAPKFKTAFYMWIMHPNASIHVKNTVPDFEVGFSLGEGGGLYITKERNKAEELNTMFFVENYDEKDSPRYPNDVIVWFGGIRPTDIHIKLPKDCTAKVSVSSLKWKDKDWQRRLDDAAERDAKEYYFPPGIPRSSPLTKKDSGTKEKK